MSKRLKRIENGCLKKKPRLKKECIKIIEDMKQDSIDLKKYFCKNCKAWHLTRLKYYKGKENR